MFVRRVQLAWSTIGAVLVLVLSIPLIAPYADAADSLPPPPQELVPKIAEAQSVGAQIYRHDHAASLATDALRKIDFQRDNRLAGWLTEERGDATVVTFIGGEGRTPRAALYRAVVSGSVVSDAQKLEPGEPLSEEQIAQFTAHTTAKIGRSRCAETFNTVVLPGVNGTERSWVVYLLPGTSKPGAIVAGGAYRVEIDRTGKKILQDRAFSKSCITLQDANNVEALSLSHLLDPSPTEFHVFLSSLARKPLYVMTTQNDLFWYVDRGRIIYVSTAAELQQDKTTIPSR